MAASEACGHRVREVVDAEVVDAEVLDAEVLDAEVLDAEVWRLGEGVLDSKMFYEDVYVSTVLCSIDDDVFPEREENRERCRTRVSFVFAMLSERGGETVSASR